MQVMLSSTVSSFHVVCGNLHRPQITKQQNLARSKDPETTDVPNHGSQFRAWNSEALAAWNIPLGK